MDEHQIESELLRSPPRRTRRRGTRGLATVFCQVLLLPLIFGIMLFLVLMTLDMTLTCALGQSVPCQITKRDSHYDDEDHEQVYHLSYQAMVNGHVKTGVEKVDRSAYDKTPLHSMQKVQVSPLLGATASVLVLPGRSVWEGMPFLWIASLVMMGGCWAMFWALVTRPRRLRVIVARGVPVVGHLTRKWKYEGTKSSSYLLYYQYTPSATTAGGEAATLTGSQGVRRGEWDAPQEGDAYTVLYDPRDPKTSLLYAYADFMAEG